MRQEWRRDVRGRTAKEITGRVERGEREDEEGDEVRGRVEREIAESMNDITDVRSEMARGLHETGTRKNASRYDTSGRGERGCRGGCSREAQQGGGERKQAGVVVGRLGDGLRGKRSVQLGGRTLDCFEQELNYSLLRGQLDSEGGEGRGTGGEEASHRREGIGGGDAGGEVEDAVEANACAPAPPLTRQQQLRQLLVSFALGSLRNACGALV